jgi:hypothetical protein
MDLRQLVCVTFISAISVAAASSEPPVGQWRLDEGHGAIGHGTAGKNDGIAHGAKWSDGTLSFQASGDYVEMIACCSPILVHRGDTRLVVQMLGKSIVGVRRGPATVRA